LEAAVTPEVQVGDWVLTEAGWLTIVGNDVAAAWFSARAERLREIRGTRDGHAWHWTREGGAK
jgi:hypothetical protein